MQRRGTHHTIRSGFGRRGDDHQQKHLSDRVACVALFGPPQMLVPERCASPPRHCFKKNSMTSEYLTPNRMVETACITSSP
mmetsp:Transcript_63283/g.173797  ORF Transcript_63283/g.173797 Transcript_63283/m.173797 type:complete len:81 (+) Transcript_63283:173-415(+)